MALISFDLDGVLQRNPFYMGSPQGVFGHVRRELAPYVPTGDPDPERAALEPLILEHMRRMEAGQIAAAHDWDEIINLVASRFGYPGRFDITALVEEYCQVEGLVYAYPGSLACLKTLEAAGHTLISITNGFRCYQEPVLRKIGLLDRFTALITPERVGAGKPERAIFDAAAQYGDGSPCIHIGDTLPHDVAGAKRAGWMAIYVVQPMAPSYSDPPAGFVDTSAWERPHLFPGWLRARLDRDRHWHGHPPVTMAECVPDAIVHHLMEIPEAVEHLLRRV